MNRNRFLSIEQLENQLNEAKKKNDDLRAELSLSKQTVKQMQEQNKLFQLYNNLKKGDISSQTLSDSNLKDIPISDDLKNAIQEGNQADYQFSEIEERLQRIIDFLVGPDKSQEFLKDDVKTNELLDYYIKVSNDISNGL